MLGVARLNFIITLHDAVHAARAQRKLNFRAERAVRGEAKKEVLKGKETNFLKLDPDRIALVKECTELMFSANQNVE